MALPSKSIATRIASSWIGAGTGAPSSSAAYSASILTPTPSANSTWCNGASPLHARAELRSKVCSAPRAPRKCSSICSGEVPSAGQRAQDDLKPRNRPFRAGDLPDAPWPVHRRLIPGPVAMAHLSLATPCTTRTVQTASPDQANLPPGALEQIIPVGHTLAHIGQLSTERLKPGPWAPVAQLPQGSHRERQAGGDRERR